MTNDSVFSQPAEIEDVRLLLQKEMAEKGTSKVKTVSGGGWEAHVKEHYPAHNYFLQQSKISP